MVSNINQASPSIGDVSPFLVSGVGVLDHAQKFTTGSSSLGYRLSSVEAQLSSFDPAISYTVTVRQDSSGSPGSVVATFTKPSFSAYTGNRVLTFSAPSTGVTLAADTNYFIVIDVTSVPDGSAAGWPVTQSQNEDASKADGWTIDNKHRLKLPSQENWQDNVITSILKLRLNGEAIPMPGVTITESGSETTVSEDGSDTDTYTVVLVSEPTHNVTVSVSAGAGVHVNKAGGSAGASQTLTFTPSDWSAEQTITVTGVDDATDNANSKRDVSIGHAASSMDSNYVIADAGSVRVTVADDDPTVVSLMRTVGNTGNLTEGDTDKVEFKVRLARALVAGERVDVPLAIAGTGIMATDFTLSKKTGDTLSQGVTLENAGTLAPTISFRGADAEEATLEIAANTDSADEGAGETLSVSLGSNTAFDNDSDTNVGGGAYPSSTANTFSFNIEEPDTTAPRITSIARHMPTASLTNANSLTWRVTFNEAVVNVDAADFILTGPNSSTNLVVSPVTGAQTTTYDVTVSAGNLANFEGAVTLGFASGQNAQDIEDTSGNALANTMPSGANDNTFVLDNTGPVVTIAGLSGTIAGASSATFTFDEAVSGFALADIIVGNGAASGLTEETDDRVWSATITPNVNGMRVTVDVGVDAARDAAGNANVKATQASAAYTAPLQVPSSFAASVGNRQVALSWAAPADNAGSAVVTKYQLRYSAGSAVNQSTSWSDIADGDDAGSDLDDETSHTVDGLINGTQYAFELRAVNTAGEGSVAKTTATPFSSDTTAPRIVSIVRRSPATSRTDADSLTWRVTFDEVVENVDAADFQASGTTATLAVSQISGTNAYDITASDGDLAGVNATVTLSFANGHDIGDTSGNALSSFVPTSGTNEDSFVVVNDPNAPKLVSIKRHAQEVRNLGMSLVWRVEFDKHLPNVYASDFTLTGTTAGLDVRHDLSNYDPVTYKTVVFVYAQGGDLESVSGTVTLSFASSHNIVDFEGRRLASTNPTGTNQHTFTLNPNKTLVYFTQPDYYVNEGEDAVVTLKLSRLRDTATSIRLSATPLTATGNGVDYHGSTYTATIPAYRASGTFKIRTSDDTLTENEETFRVDIHPPFLPAGMGVTNAPGATGNDGQAYIRILDEDTATAKAKTEPDLVFDNAYLTWNEAEGCGDTGPTYNVKLKNRPAGPVDVLIKDPDDDYRSDYVAKNRLYVANSRGSNYEHEHTILHFTPDNWDTYQLVNVKVRCADHYTAQIPIKHRIDTNYIGDKGQLSHAYPGYAGVVDKGWTVHVKVREADPPIVARGLPAPDKPVDVKEGGHVDFEIILSESAFEHHSRLPVYLSARGGKAAGVKRRDGSARSCGGPFDDCLYFTPENRTQWVRLFAINPGRDELKVEIPQLLWGDLGDLPLVRDWDMRWPVQVSPVSQGAPAEGAAVAPTQAVSSLRVTAIDAVSASVTWNAVEHARFHEVSWEAESSDGQTVISGMESVAGTSATIQHNAQEDMTLNVTVTPEYVDGNGITQRMETLAATATLDIGPSSRQLGNGGTSGGGDGGPIQAGEGPDLPAPVAHWRFDGDADDSTGSSHGTARNGASFTANGDGEGVGSHALVLDGSDDHVDLGSHVSNFPLGDAARTVTGWFKADTGNQRQTFFTYGPNVAGQRFSIAADRTQILIGVSGHAWGVNGLSLDDGWHHVAVTFAGGDSDSISIYLDGEPQAASTLVGASQSVDTRTGPAAIGRNVSGAAHYAGSIDDVRIYDAALDAEQVLALFGEHLQTPPPPVTTVVTASMTPALAEGNLDGASVVLTLDAGAFAVTVAASDVTVSGLAGAGVPSVTRDSDSQITATLAFGGTDFDADATLTLTVAASALIHSDTDLSVTLTVTAVDEPPPPPPPPPATSVSIPAPVSHWRFDGDADDAAGTRDGTASNGASFTTNASIGSHALSLDGIDDHVELSTHVSRMPLGNAARSITGWFRADAGNQGQTFFSYGPNEARKRFSIAADRTQAVVGVSGYASGVRNLNLDAGWHHIAVIYAGGDAKDLSIYLNGVLQSAELLGGFRRTLDTRPGPAAIGRSADGTRHYGGDIDDVRLYNYALSAEQVGAIAGRKQGAQPAAAFPVRAPMGPQARGWSASGMSWGMPGTAAAGMHHGAVDVEAPDAGVRMHVPLLPSASNPRHEGFVRIVNPTARAGPVRILAVDDTGRRSERVVLGMGAGEIVEFTSRDLEWGSAALDPGESTGPGIGDWRLEVKSDLEVEVLGYVRTADGTLSEMGGVAPSTDNVHRLALFHPADSSDAASLLRLTNRGGQALVANITGIDDTGISPGGVVSVEIGAYGSVLLTAAELESGGADLLGALGDGGGVWRLDIASDGDLAVMHLVETPNGHLANLSNAEATPVPAGVIHSVAGLPSGAVESGEMGVLRIVNGSGKPGSVRIRLHDGVGWRYAPLTFSLGGGEAVNLNALDLELGNTSKGLTGSTGPGSSGEWRLEISGDIDIEVMVFVRSPTGLLEVLPRSGA